MIRPHYSKFEKSELRQIFRESSKSMRPNTAHLIYNLPSNASMTLPQMVATKIDRIKDPRRFKRFEGRLGRFVQIHSIPHKGWIRIPPATRAAKLYSCGDLIDKLTERAYYMAQILAEGMEPSSLR